MAIGKVFQGVVPIPFVKETNSFLLELSDNIASYREFISVLV